MPSNLKPLSFVFADQDSEAVYLMTDLNGDGDVADSGEQKIYFGGGNASGLADPLLAPLDLFQAKDGSVVVSDNASDTVYRVKDLNGDGDAQDAGEARVWFSAAGNANGYTLATPNGVGEDSNGAVYVVLAGTGGQPADRIYRTIDRNGDGDAQDAGESSIWIDLQTLNSKSSAFEIEFIGDVAYVTDTNGSDPDTIYRLEDKNHNGVIDAGEATTFISDSNSLGVAVEYPFAIKGDVFYNIEFANSGANRLFAFQDKDGSGSIDQANEATEVWNETFAPAGYGISVLPGVGIAPDGSILVASNGTSSQPDTIFRLVDLNNDGDFKDAGETIVAVSSKDGATYLSKPRPVDGYVEPGINTQPTTGTSGIDARTLKSADDHYTALGGNDVVKGGKGDDTLFGNDGNDALYGDKDDDQLFGGDGRDALYGGDGEDYLDGGEGNDLLSAGGGDDELYGFGGDDRLVFKVGAETTDFADGGDGHDTLAFDGLTAKFLRSSGLLGEMAAFEDAAAAAGGQPFGFTFASIGLTVSNIEALG